NSNVFCHQNRVNIKKEKLVPIQQVEIIDMYGRVVWTGEAVGEKTEITLNVAAGIYGVRIATGEGQYFTTKVIINN
ncbi:MAG: T9SS type A sorting domain-containing protein, partial [Bacteroidales bacterium]|nr:T9SS type A sorting domain-containing protein [Bacteroidales bacterium]